jgi:hypothetical protein
MAGGEARSDVVVLANRTREPIAFDARTGDGPMQSYRIHAADLISIRVDDVLSIEFGPAPTRRRHELGPNSIYFFHAPAADGELELRQIGLVGAEGLGEVDDSPEGTVDEPEAPRPDRDHRRTAAKDRPTNPLDTDGKPAMATVRVKLLVDDDERASRSRWEERLRNRLQAASIVFERYAQVRFEVVATDRWKSDERLQELDDAVKEFENLVEVKPADLAIGFTSQQELSTGCAPLVGDRGALKPHLLIREWSEHATEPERLEHLVHELGHYLGAAHSPEPDSVFRPMLGDGQARRRGYRIRFDPVNTLAMCLVGEALRTPPIRGLADLGPDARATLGQIYETLAATLPDDSAAQDCLRRLNEEPSAADDAPPPANEKALEESTRAVLEAIVAAAEANERLPDRQAGDDTSQRLTGDPLAEHYASVAAAAAARQPGQQRIQSFFLALAMALDTSDILRKSPLGGFLSRIEPDEVRTHRLEVIGRPTMRGRQDLALHFFASAAIAANAGRKAAEAAGLAKELRDADGGSGFSFSDWCADLAGVEFVERMASDGPSLQSLSDGFRVVDHLPSVSGLEDGLTQSQFSKRYGSTTDPRFRDVHDEILRRIETLWSQE